MRTPGGRAFRGLARIARRLRRDEGGFSLLELIVVCTISTVVVGVPLTLVVQSYRGQNQATSRGAATNRVEIGLARLMQDLRHAVHTSTVSATGATLTVPVRSATGGTPSTQQIVWACTNGVSCTRQVAGGTPFPVIPYLVSATFAPTSASGSTSTPQADPAYVQVTISVLDSNESGGARTATVAHMTKPITMTDGVALRNFAL